MPFTARQKAKCVLWFAKLDVLQHFFIPQLQQDKSMDIVFQQDGAPPHWATVVRDYLDNTFDRN